MITRHITIRCDQSRCEQLLETTTHDTLKARRQARVVGWAVGRTRQYGTFTDYCPDHAGGRGGTFRYRHRGGRDARPSD